MFGVGLPVAEQCNRTLSSSFTTIGPMGPVWAPVKEKFWYYVGGSRADIMYYLFSKEKSLYIIVAAEKLNFNQKVANLRRARFR